MDNYPEEFTDLQKRPSDELAEIIADCCDKLFELFNTFADSPRKKAAVWPLQMMLLVLCPVSGIYSWVFFFVFFLFLFFFFKISRYFC